MSNALSLAAQVEAMRRHPELARAGSPFNTEFLARVQRYESENADYFAKADWPLLLANEVAASGVASIRIPSADLPPPTSLTGGVMNALGMRLINGLAFAPATAPSAIHIATAAGNYLQNKRYKWGGGHGKVEDSGYDCSGSVSYVLIKAGLLSRPLTSSGFASYGESGPGRWITIYAGSGHVYMTVCGIRLDTGGRRGRGESGPRWSPIPRYAAGFKMRHPPGM